MLFCVILQYECVSDGKNMYGVILHVHSKYVAFIYVYVNIISLALCAVLPVNIVKELEPVKTTVNERIELECEVSEEGAQVKWCVYVSLCKE